MPRHDTLNMETTAVPASRTLGEITAELVAAGAVDISTTYEQGRPAGLRWSMRLYGQLVWFKLPVKVQAVETYLVGKRKHVSQSDRQRIQDQAERVAWRQLLRWVQVQMTMIRLDMLEFAQVFLPYIANAEGGTVWEHFRDKQLQIEGPKQ